VTGRPDRVDEVEAELEKGLHLHHHLSSRRERAMLATLGFLLALAATRGVTSFLPYRGAGPKAASSSTASTSTTSSSASSACS
jgi:hypothetical protein